MRSLGLLLFLLALAVALAATLATGAPVRLRSPPLFPPLPPLGLALLTARGTALVLALAVVHLRGARGARAHLDERLLALAVLLVRKMELKGLEAVRLGADLIAARELALAVEELAIGAPALRETGDEHACAAELPRGDGLEATGE